MSTHAVVAYAVDLFQLNHVAEVLHSLRELGCIASNNVKQLGASASVRAMVSIASAVPPVVGMCPA